MMRSRLVRIKDDVEYEQIQASTCESKYDLSREVTGMGNCAARKKIRAIAIIAMLLVLCNCASAYYLYLDAPANVRLGEDIYVEGSTNTPSPDVVHIIFSQVSNFPVEISRVSIPIEERGETTFTATFETSGLDAGRYRIEGVAESKRNFSGDSRILRVVTLEDRTSEVTLTGQREQWVSDVLKVVGNIRDFKDSSVSFELKRDDTTIFGPAQVPVVHGRFEYDIPVNEPGEYILVISDYRGHIGEYSYTLASEPSKNDEKKDEITRPTQEVPPTPAQTETVEPQILETEVPSTVTATATEQPQTVVTDRSEPTPTTPSLDETTADFAYDDHLSRADAGFYVIEPSADIVTLTTTTGVDWVIEYIDPVTGTKQRVNEAGPDEAESVRISTAKSPLYVKIYPYSFNDVSDITIFGTGIKSMGASNKARVAFGAPPAPNMDETIVTADSSNSTPGSPLSLWTLFAGCGVGAWLLCRRDFR